MGVERNLCVQDRHLRSETGGTVRQGLIFDINLNFYPNLLLLDRKFLPLLA